MFIHLCGQEDLAMFLIKIFVFFNRMCNSCGGYISKVTEITPKLETMFKLI